MINFFLLLLNVSFAAENSVMFSCKTQNQPRVELIIDTLFNSQLNLYATKNAYACNLGIKNLEYIPRGLVPGLTVEYIRGECSEELPKEWLVLERLNVSMQFLKPKIPTARLQWKIGEGSFECEIRKFDNFAFFNFLEQWRKDPSRKKIDSLKVKKPEKPIKNPSRISP